MYTWGGADLILAFDGKVEYMYAVQAKCLYWHRFDVKFEGKEVKDYGSGESAIHWFTITKRLYACSKQNKKTRNADISSHLEYFLERSISSFSPP